jgi:hypothetical protein
MLRANILMCTDKCTLNLTLSHDSETEVNGVFYLLKSFACFKTLPNVEPDVIVIMPLPNLQLLKDEHLLQMALPGCCSVCGSLTCTLA